MPKKSHKRADDRPKKETFESIQAEVKDYSQVADTLRKKQDLIDQQIKQEEQTNKLLHQYTDERKQELARINKKNLKLSYEIEELQARMDKIRANAKAKNQSSLFLTEHSGPLPIEAASKLSKTNADLIPELLSGEQQKEVSTYQDEIKRGEKEIRQLLNQVKAKSKYSKVMDQTSLLEFFNECIKASEKEILRSHELTQLQSKGDGDLVSSFFYELHRKKFVNSKPAVPLKTGSMEPNKAAYETRVLDRHNKNVIYQTIKSIIETAKEEKKKAHILSISIDWEEIKQFSPI